MESKKTIFDIVAKDKQNKLLKSGNMVCFLDIRNVTLLQLKNICEEFNISGLEIVLQLDKIENEN